MYTSDRPISYAAQKVRVKFVASTIHERLATNFTRTFGLPMPIYGKLPDKTVCFKSLFYLTGLDVLSDLQYFVPFTLFLGFRTSSRISAIISSLAQMESACSERDFPIEIFAFNVHSLKPDGFFM